MYYDGSQTPTGVDMANGYGLYNMAGNVWDWCNDRYDGSYYSSSPYNNPRGPASGREFVLRGGSWDYGAYDCRCAIRPRNTPDSRYYNRGFRLTFPGGTSHDCNSNGVPDECELADNDCNTNSVPDECDIAGGTSEDANANGIPDECEQPFLVLFAPDCSDDAVPSAAGYQMAVELSMRDLPQAVTGFQSFLAFESGQLAYRGDLSSYTATPFTIHIQSIATAEYSPGRLRLDGSAFAGASADALLATLIFDVVQECGSTAVTFDLSQPGLESKLSYQGTALLTTLLNMSPVVLDDTAPTGNQSSIADCYATAAEAEAAALAATTNLADNCTGSPDIVLATSSSGLCTDATTTVTVTDLCGNATAFVYETIIGDTQVPVVTCGNMNQNADAGGCDTEVVLQATAVDDCGGTLPAEAIEFLIDVAGDGFNGGDDVPVSGSGSTYVFPPGTTPVRASATDGCNQTGFCEFSVTIAPLNSVAVSVELPGVYLPSSRCVHFVADDCGVDLDAELIFLDHDGDDLNANGVVDATEGSSNSPATPVRATTELGLTCGDWSQLCGKDEQHTLWTTVGLSVAGAAYQAETVLSLSGGDTDNDGTVDIDDVTFFIYRYGQAAAAGSCPWDGVRDADFDNNGFVGAEDYTFLTAYWLTVTQCACTLDFGSGAQAGIALSLPAEAVPESMRTVVDRNRDGSIDHLDVEQFEREQGLPNTLSRKMRTTGGSVGPPPQLRR